MVLDATALELSHQTRIVHLQVILQLRDPIADKLGVGFSCYQGMLVCEVPCLSRALLVCPLEGRPEVRMKSSHHLRQLSKTIPDKWFV